jgi:M6 family metalloprotease-like protein
MLHYHPLLMKRCILAITALLLLGSASTFADTLSGMPLSRPRINPAASLYQREALDRLSTASIETVDELSLLVIRVSFSDMNFGIGADGNTHDSLYFENELRHLREYFTGGASLARFTLDVPMHAEVVPLSREEAYYGEDGEWEMRVSEMVMEVVEAIDDVVDFSQYEGIAFIHPGSGQETDFNGDSSDQLWSGFLDPEEMTEAIADTLGTPGIPTDDLISGETYYIDNAIVWPAQASQDGYIFGSLGIYAYQIGLRIGMIPLFDTTPGSFPDSQGIGNFGLMGYGIYNAAGFIPAFPCAFHRYLMGWVDVVDIEADVGIRLKDISSAQGADTSLVRLSISPSEYFLIANRVHDTDFDGRFDFTDINSNGFPENQDTLLGAEFDFFVSATTNPDLPAGGVDTGSGLLIWHVDESIILSQLAVGGYPNDNASLKGVDLEEADGIQDLDRPGGSHSFGSYLDAFRDGVNTSFGPETNPWSRSNSGMESGILIDGISVPGEYMDLDVSFDIPSEMVRVELPGDVGALSPIPINYYASPSDLVASIDAGFVLYANAVGSSGWTGDIDTIAAIPGAIWSGPPIACNAGADSRLGIFVTTRDGMFYAFHTDGTPYPVGDPSNLGSLRLEGDVTAAPIAMELRDGDIESEVILLSSDADNTYIYIIGFSDTWEEPHWEMAGTEIIRSRLMEGRLISHPAFGHVYDRDGASEDYGGLYIATVRDSSSIYVHYIDLTVGLAQHVGFDQPLEYYSQQVGTIMSVPRSLCAPAAGKIHEWYDWIDVGVFAIEGLGLVYYNPFKDLQVAELVGARASPPVLADLDQDGAMETVLRDRYSLYIFQGFGKLATEWPKEIPQELIDLEGTSAYASPIIADVDGNESSDVIFRVGGDLYAFSLGGSLLEGWPISGEGRSPSTPMLVETEDQGLYLFVMGSHDLIGGAETVSSSALRRYALPDAMFLDTSWPSYRHDFLGSSRQNSPFQSNFYSGFEEESFICYPNPAKGDFFTVRVMLANYAGEVSVTLLNLEGEVVYSTTGRHEFPESSLVPFEAQIPTKDLTPGIYLCRLVVKGLKDWEGVRKVAVIK